MSWLRRLRLRWRLMLDEASLDAFLDDPANCPPNACCPWCKGSYWLKILHDNVVDLRAQLGLPGRSD